MKFYWGIIMQKAMKLTKLLMILTLGLSLLLLSACISSNSGTRTITGSGPMISQDFEVNSFNAINVSGNYSIIWRESVDISVTAVMQENLLEYVDVSVRGGTLYVEARRSFSTTGDNTPRIYIYAPNITGLNISGAATAANWDTIQTRDFTVQAEGAASLNLDFDVESLDVQADGAVTINFTGSVSNATIVLNGAGNVDIAVEDYLNVELNGVGRVRYTGNPTVTQTINGIGTVQQAR